MNPREEETMKIGNLVRIKSGRLRCDWLGWSDCGDSQRSSEGILAQDGLGRVDTHGNIEGTQ